VLYILIVVLDPSSPSSSPQVTEARNGLPFILVGQRNFRTFDRQRAEVWPEVLTFGMSGTDTGHVGNWHSVCRHPRAELGQLSVYMNQQKLVSTKC